MDTSRALHVAIVMDGNGRWAEARGLPRSAGHRAGAKAVRRVVEAARRRSIATLTLFAFSSDNWKRPPAEVSGLMDLFEEFLRAETAACRAQRIAIEVVGRRDRLSASLLSAIDTAESATTRSPAMRLRIAVDYSSREAIRRGELGPDVDLWIRTGGEHRLSDFLLWESAYAELWFSPEPWPDFEEADLDAALAAYAARDRRFGRIPVADHDRVDVLVVGAGLAGLQAARLLARQGLTVAVADRRPDPFSGVRTTGIFVRKTLEDFAFPVGTLGPAVRSVILRSPSLRPISLASANDEFRVGRMERLYRAWLDDARNYGARWLPGTEFVASRPSPEGSIVTLRTREGTTSLHARFLVGADGARSVVARDLALDRNEECLVGVEDVYRGVPLSGEPRFECVLDPAIAPGYLAWLVHDGEEVHLGVGGYRDRFEPGKALDLFRERAGSLVDLSGAERLERRGGPIPVGGILARIACRRGLLVGDAAGAPSPLTAGGLDPCLRLSTLAAEVIPEYLASGDSSDLARYDGRRFRARFASRLAMRRLASVLAVRPAAEAACAALALPGGRALAWHVFFGRGSFPDVPVSSALARVAATPFESC